jgi:hypothetical protein
MNTEAEFEWAVAIEMVRTGKERKDLERFSIAEIPQPDDHQEFSSLNEQAITRKLFPKLSRAGENSLLFARQLRFQLSSNQKWLKDNPNDPQGAPTAIPRFIKEIETIRQQWLAGEYRSEFEAMTAILQEIVRVKYLSTDEPESETFSAPQNPRL